MVEHVPSQTSQRFLAKEASTEPEEDEAQQPTENEENGAKTSASKTGPEKQNCEKIDTERAGSRRPKKIRSGPSRSYLMQYIEGEKKIGKDDYDDESEENSKERDDHSGNIGGGKSKVQALQGSEEDTNIGINLDDGDADLGGGRKRRRVSKEDIVNAALKKDREEREAAEEERTKVKRQRPKSPLDCLTPGERWEVPVFCSSSV